MLYRNFLKPILDFLLSFIGLALASPVFLVVAALLAIVNRGNPFFFQLRPGKGGKVFRIVKFKTMNDKRDVKGNLLPDGQRLTQTGKLVRKTSLDEIPQLINVLKGDMSLIGPRPLLIQYLPIYNKEQARHHEVRPEITGWAQVNGRNAISWEQKFKLDVWYVENLNFLLDLEIIFLTLIKIFKREGIYKAGDITSMEAFNGEN